MYNEYFGFKETPFSIAPDPRYLYMTAQHRDALAHLIYGLNSEGGCILLTGEVGTGKTTICRCLLDQLPEQANVALVLNPKVSEIELLETICDELHISYPASGNSVKIYTDRIYEFLIASHRKNEKIVLIIDEAQNLDSTVLEQLRLLTNLETNQRKLLQIIILGQPELLDILAKSEMRQLAQRITARFHLQPLSRHEVKAYVSHRIAVAGQNVQLFPEKSIKLLYKLSHGIPRLINIICDRALLGAYVENQYSVNPLIIKKAATEVFGELKNIEQQQHKKRWPYPVAALSIALIITAATLFYLDNKKITDSVHNSSPKGTEQTPVTAHSENLDTATSAASEAVNANNQPPALARNSLAETSDDNLVAEMPANTSLSASALVDSAEASVNHDNIKDILNNAENNQAAAYRQLFNAWGRQYDINAKTTMCNQAAAYALQCLHKQGNLNSLKVHNRPAVLTLLNDQGETRHVTLTAISNDTASIYANNKTYTIKLAELDQHWYGQFILLWKKPADYSSAIMPGDQGKIIRWLNDILNRINQPGSTLAADSRYHHQLVAQVKKFQSAQGLMADGIVGPLTIIHLHTQSGMQVPSLIQPASPQLNQQG